MSDIPNPDFDKAPFFFDSSDKFGCPDPSLYYRRPQQCIIPTPVFNDESPLFSFHGPQDSTTGPATDPDAPRGPSRSELERLSTRPYAARVADESDFAQVWERTILPIVIDILQASCECDFSVDAHNFPELGSDSVPRVIYITLPVAAPLALRERVRDELARRVPRRFHRTHLKFRQGAVRRTNWWGTDEKHRDGICEPRNSTFQPVPSIGMSVGPHRSDDAGSVGGFVKVGNQLYGLSARHVFEDAVVEGDLRVVHPAHGDHKLNVSSDPNSQQAPMGELYRWSGKDSTRVSATFDGGAYAEHNRVAMDWCLFGPVPEGKNFLAVPCFDMRRVTAIEKSDTVEGNTEVYALARTSGYSLGFTSDVPGIQKLEGVLRREWTVRQYNPSKWDPAIHLEPPWQSIKAWVTSGIGVQGDSGAWLMRRRDNAVIGLIWARNHNHGTPVERVRLTYITPIVDILADIRERVAGDVTLPTYSEAEVCYNANRCMRRRVLDLGQSAEPWSHLSMSNPRRSRGEDESATRSGTAVIDSQGYSPSTSPSLHSSEVSLQGSYASVGADHSAAAESIGPSRGTAVRIREGTLLGIGALPSFQLGRPDWVSPPSLEIDFGTDSSVSSYALEDLDSRSLNGSVRVAIQGEAEHDVDFAELESPIRSKATFQHVDMQLKLPNTIF